MKINLWHIFLAFVFVAMIVGGMNLLTSCAPALSDETTSTIEISSQTNQIGRYIDKEAGVVCWIFYGYKAGGISCLPLADTKLDK